MKKAETTDKAEETKKSVQEYLTSIKYKSDGETYSFELEKKEYTLKGFPSIIEKAKIGAIYSSIAPGVSSSIEAIFKDGDMSLKALSKGIAYGKVLLISCKEKEKEIEDPLELDEGKTPDTSLIVSFGMRVLMAEIEFQNSKKKG